MEFYINAQYVLIREYPRTAPGCFKPAAPRISSIKAMRNSAKPWRRRDTATPIWNGRAPMNGLSGTNLSSWPCISSADKVHCIDGFDVVKLGEQRQVFGHNALFDGGNAGRLQIVGKLHERRIFVHLAPLAEGAAPGKDGGHGIGGRFLALLVPRVSL